MAFDSVDATPIFADENTSLIIDYDEVYGDAIQLACGVNQCTPNFENRFASVATLCDPAGEKPARGSQSFRIRGWLSHGDGVDPNPLGMYDALAPKFGQLCTFAFLYDHTAAVSSTNKEISGKVWIPRFSPFGFETPEDPQPLEFELKVSGVLAVTGDPLAAVVTHPLGPIV